MNTVVRLWHDVVSALESLHPVVLVMILLTLIFIGTWVPTVGWQMLTKRFIAGRFICEPCREGWHGACRGDTWCDCQHRNAEADLSMRSIY